MTGGDKVSDLVLGLLEETANKKIIGMLFLPIKETAKKTILDKFPFTQIANITKQKLLNRCGQAFKVERNTILDTF